MIGVYIFTAAILTLAWGVLSESFSLFTMLTGLLVSVCCILFANKFLPLYKIKNVSYLRLLTYPFYLIGQMYLSALSNIKMILTDSYADYVTVKTSLTSDFLKVLLSHSITLTPGTVSLDLSENELTILYLSSRKQTNETPNPAQSDFKKMEKRLLKAQKIAKGKTR